MNFNFSQKPDYELNTRMIDELIKLYGTKVTLVLTDKIQNYGPHYLNKPENSVFNDFKTLKSMGVERELYVLINESEGYPSGLNFMFGQYGIHNDDTLQVLVSLGSLEFLGSKPVKELVSSLMVFPNNKVMEVTDCQIHVPGVNNKFVYDDKPACFMLSLKSHNFDNSAVSLAVKEQGILNKIQPTFFEIDGKSQNIKEYNQRPVLVTENFVDKVDFNKIDDVFGTS